MDQLLKPADVVRYLGTSRTWVYDAAKRGDIPSIRLGSADGPLHRTRPRELDQRGARPLATRPTSRRESTQHAPARAGARRLEQQR